MVRWEKVIDVRSESLAGQLSLTRGYASFLPRLLSGYRISSVVGSPGSNGVELHSAEFACVTLVMGHSHRGGCEGMSLALSGVSFG